MVEVFKPFNILIVGPGALGCILASILSDGGAGIAFLGRKTSNQTLLAFEVQREDGNNSSYQFPYHSSLKAASIALSQGPSNQGKSPAAFDWVLVCVKSGDTEGAAEALAGLPGETPVLLFQNGLEGPRRFLAVKPDQNLYGAVTSHGALRWDRGTFRHSGHGPSILAPVQRTPKLEEAGKFAEAGKIAKALTACGLATTARPDLQTLLWSKATVNAAINALGALLLVPNGALLESEAAAALAQTAANEAYQTAQALGYELDEGPEAWRQVAERTAGNACSTLQDVLARRPSEVAAINGAIAKAGRGLGIDVSVNTCLARLMAAREQTYSQHQDLIDLGFVKTRGRRSERTLQQEEA